MNRGFPLHLMTVVLAITIVVVLAIVAAGTVMTYHALWKVWQSIPSGRRRRYVLWQVAGFSTSGGLLALLIAAPWGTKNTILYVFGGLCLIAILAVFIGVRGEGVKALRSRKRKARSDRGASGSTSGHP